MKKHDPLDPYRERATALAAVIVKFFNVAFKRNIRGGRLLQDAIAEAMLHKYTDDEIRVVYWIAPCLTGKAAWLGSALRGDLLPDVALRFKGGINNITGKPAIRWLDEMLARSGEVNPVLTKALMDTLPEDMREGERELLRRMGVPING